MSKILYVLLTAIILSGCMTTKGPDPILTDFASVVFNDGITFCFYLEDDRYDLACRAVETGRWRYSRKRYHTIFI